MLLNRKSYRSFIFLSVLTWVGDLHAVEVMNCGSLEVGYGPFDYTNPRHYREKLPVVEKAHFTKNVENLVRGESVANPMGDIGYTLNRFPNHHRALYAMVRYRLREKNPPPPGARKSAECWFDRAMRFKPSDGVVRMIYGLYLQKKGKYTESLQRYKEARELMLESPELHYNMGLLLFEMKDYEQSKEHAVRAYELGYPLPGLQRKLKSVGVWNDQPTQ